MTCKMCLERTKNWCGDDSVCYFDDPSRNWNCATLNGIRDICYEGPGQLPKSERLRATGVHYEYCDDYKFATINIHDVQDSKENYFGRCLYVVWYKNSGATEALWILDGENDTPRTPTEDELLAIINYYALLR